MDKIRITAENKKLNSNTKYTHMQWQYAAHFNQVSQSTNHLVAFAWKRFTIVTSFPFPFLVCFNNKYGYFASFFSFYFHFAAIRLLAHCSIEISKYTYGKRTEERAYVRMGDKHTQPNILYFLFACLAFQQNLAYHRISECDMAAVRFD